MQKFHISILYTVPYNLQMFGNKTESRLKWNLRYFTIWPFQESVISFSAVFKNCGAIIDHRASIFYNLRPS